MYKITMHKDYSDGVGTIIHYPNRSSTKITSGSIAQGINVVDSFIFDVNIGNPGYTLGSAFKTLVTVLNTKTNKLEFDGYILKQSGSYDIDGSYSKTISCVSGLNYLKESKQAFGEFHNLTPKDFLTEILRVHNTQVEPEKRFQLGTVNVTNSTDNVYRYTDQEATTFDTIFDKLIDRIGGELKVRHEMGIWYLDWLNTTGEVKQTEIRVGRNLKSASRDEDTEDVYTRWFVYGAQVESTNPDDTGAAKARITIGSVNGGKDYIDDPVGIAQFGIRVGHITFNEVNDKNILKSKGISYMNTYKQVKISNVVTALDLALINLDMDTYEVSNWHPLYNPGLADREDIRIIEKRIDINNPQSTSLTLGDKYLTATQFQASTKKNQRIVDELRETVIGQSTSIRQLVLNNTAISEQYQAIQMAYNKLATSLEIDDATGTSAALANLSKLIEDMSLNFAPVTQSSNGLMLKEDKKKLDEIVPYQLATPDTKGLMSPLDKQKINLMTITSPVDLTDLERRIALLEQP